MQINLITHPGTYSPYTRYNIATLFVFLILSASSRNIAALQGIFWNPKEFASFLVNLRNGTGRYFALVESGRPWKLVEWQERKIVWGHGILVLLLIFPLSLNHCQEYITWCTPHLRWFNDWLFSLNDKQRIPCSSRSSYKFAPNTCMLNLFSRMYCIVINIDHNMRRSLIQNFRISVWCSSWWEISMLDQYRNPKEAKLDSGCNPIPLHIDPSRMCHKAWATTEYG